MNRNSGDYLVKILIGLSRETTLKVPPSFLHHKFPRD
jgi:hypothetical protein